MKLTLTNNSKIILIGLLVPALLLTLTSFSFAQYRDQTMGEQVENKIVGKGGEYRSTVSSAVAKLTELAGKDKNIGEELKMIAKEQEESKEKVAEAIEMIESRNWLKTFLIGTDYKNLGKMRSELVTTENHINRLTKAEERAKDPEVKAELQEQRTILESTMEKVESFIKENEDKFSVFGWVVKMINR